MKYLTAGEVLLSQFVGADWVLRNLKLNILYAAKINCSQPFLIFPKLNLYVLFGKNAASPERLAAVQGSQIFKLIGFCVS